MEMKQTKCLYFQAVVGVAGGGGGDDDDDDDDDTGIWFLLSLTEMRGIGNEC
jgi:hypothetical protein